MTKKDNIPLLSLTIITNNLASSRASTSITTTSLDLENAPFPVDEAHRNNDSFGDPNPGFFPHDRETTITQDLPVIVLAAATVASIHEPQCPQPDVHIILPSLLQLKAISERFTKLALSTSTSTSNRGRASEAAASQSRLILSANAHGVLRIGVETPSLKIESKWEGLTNPELDPEQVEGGEEGVRGHASTRMKEREGEQAWSVVRVEGRDWGRVLGVGRLGGRVIACEYSWSGGSQIRTAHSQSIGFCHGHALILYVYLSGDDTESVLTVCLFLPKPPSQHVLANEKTQMSVLYSILQRLTPS